MVVRARISAVRRARRIEINFHAPVVRMKSKQADLRTSDFSVCIGNIVTAENELNGGEDIAKLTPCELIFHCQMSNDHGDTQLRSLITHSAGGLVNVKVWGVAGGTGEINEGLGADGAAKSP